MRALWKVHQCKVLHYLFDHHLLRWDEEMLREASEGTVGWIGYQPTGLRLVSPGFYMGINPDLHINLCSPII